MQGLGSNEITNQFKRTEEGTFSWRACCFGKVLLCFGRTLNTEALKNSRFIWVGGGSWGRVHSCEK